MSQRSVRLKESLTAFATRAGMIGPVLFIAIFTLAGSLSPGHSPARMPVSALSLGSTGWLQILNFIQLGICTILFGLVLFEEERRNHRAAVGPILWMVLGICLFLSGPFVMDAPDAARNQWTTHGWIHQILGAIFFTLAPIVCFLYAFKTSSLANQKSSRTWSLVIGCIFVLCIVAMKMAQLQALDSFLTPWFGIYQRIALISFLSWMFKMAMETMRRTKA